MLRLHTFLRFLSCAVAILALTVRVPARAGSLDEPAPSLPIDEWLSQGEKKQFHCDVHVSQPTLTFQQRYRVFVKAKVPAVSLQRESIQRDLHFFVKVADENGKWLSGHTYNHFRVEKQFDKRMEIELEAGLYLQPGRYTIAVIVYDTVTQEHNVVFRRLTVETPKHDAFPKLLTDLPRVEFLPAPIEGIAALASGHALLPVQTERPIELDLVVDLSPYTRRRTLWAQSVPGSDASSPRGIDPFPGGMRQRDMSRSQSITLPVGFRRPLPEGVRRTVKGFQSRLLEAASILGDLNPTNGCTRITVFNTLSRRLLMTAQPAFSADWLKTWDDVFNTDLNVITVQDLAGSVEAAKFLHDQIQSLMSLAPPCKLESQRPVRILAVLSRGAHFPDGAAQPRIDTKCDCKVFYLLEHEDLTDLFDDLHGMLKPLSPTRLEFSDPGQFRHKLSDLIRTIQELGSD